MKTICFVSLIALATSTAVQAETLAEIAAAAGDNIVVTGSRTIEGVEADSLGASITVLDSAALEQRQTRVISDILRDVPGIAISRTGAVGGLTQVRIRGGEGNHTLVLIDGIEASDPFQGEFDFGGLIAEDGARIEVLRGQQSAIYGSDAIGGVIHYITASGREKPGYSARVEYGSQNTLSGAARIGGVAGDSFDYAVSGSYNRTDGYPVAVGGVRDIGAESWVVSSKLNWTPTDNFRVQAVGRYSRTEADTTASSPTTFAPIDGTNNYKTRAIMGLLRAELDLLEGRWTHAATAQLNDNIRRAFGGATGASLTSANEGQRIKASYDTSLRLGEEGALHTLTAAADFERESFRNLPPAAPQPLSNTRKIENTGLVGEYRFTAGDWLSLGGSVRYDHNDRFRNATTYRASASARLNAALRLRAAYGTGIKNPTPFELYGFSNSATVFIGNPNLRPETSKGWEAGFDLTMPGEDIRFGLTYFDARLKNEIFSGRVGNVSTPDNRATDSTQHGIELSFAARVSDWLRIDASYTYLDAKENGAEEIRRAPHIASANVHVQPVEQVSVTATARYNGETYDSNFTMLPGVGPRVLLDDFVLVNLAADWKVTPNISVFGRVENLFDEEYTEVFGFRTPGRTGAVGIRAGF
jgi:vitamin B12 transporter